MERQAYIFDHLQNPIDSDIEDFVTLIPHLTGRPTDFETIERNLESIREILKTQRLLFTKQVKRAAWSVLLRPTVPSCFDQKVG
jgi:hypothetical protein